MGLWGRWMDGRGVVVGAIYIVVGEYSVEQLVHARR